MPRLELSGTRSRQDAGTVPIWFATNRKPEERFAFGGEVGSGVAFGQVDVSIPRHMRAGDPEPSWWRRWRAGAFRKDIVAVQKTDHLGEQSFYESLEQAASDAGEDGRNDALLYIHGFNVTFERAARTAARLAWNLDIPGTTAFYS